MKLSIGQLINIFIPLGIILILIFIDSGLGALLLLLYIAYTVYKSRSGIFSKLGSDNYRKGNIEAAIKWYMRAFKTGRAAASVILSYALLLEKAGDFTNAERAINAGLNKAYSDYDKNAALVLKILHAWKTDSVEKALELLTELPEDFENSTMYACLGAFYLGSGITAKAHEFNKRAYEFNSTNSSIKDNLVRTYYLEGAYEKAEEICNSIQNPVTVETYVNMALLSENKGELDKAINAINLASNYSLSHISFLSEQDYDDIRKRILHLTD